MDVHCEDGGLSRDVRGEAVLELVQARLVRLNSSDDVNF